MKILKSKTAENARLSSHPSEIGRSIETRKRTLMPEQPQQRREMYRTQHLYEDEESHRHIHERGSDSNEDSEEFMNFLNSYIRQLKSDPEIKTSKLDHIKEKLQQERKFNRRMMKMVMAMQQSLNQRDEELERILKSVEAMKGKENFGLDETKKLYPRKQSSKYRIEDFLRGPADELNVTDDSVVDYRIERNHTEAASSGIGRRKSTIHCRQQSKLPLEDLEQFISQSINMRRKK